VKLEKNSKHDYEFMKRINDVGVIDHKIFLYKYYFKTSCKMDRSFAIKLDSCTLSDQTALVSSAHYTIKIPPNTLSQSWP